MQAFVDYRYFHIFWLIGAILTRRYRFCCSGCGAEVQARFSRLRKQARSGNTRFYLIGPVFVIWWGGALVLIGPGDYSD
ncbi:MAG: hypothetical protein GC160_03615 [Acidobacteria bacterium]|nr:hypothetical protein [Acidobacteriota bacterium]